MRSNTLSSSSSTSAAIYFNFWSKVGLFCVNFFLHALLGFALTSLEVLVAEPSLTTIFSSCWFWRVLHELLGRLSFLCYFTLTFFQVRFSLKAVNVDALAFAIAPNASVCALGLRNFTHSTEPHPEPVFLSPPLSLSPSQFMSLALVF